MTFYEEALEVFGPMKEIRMNVLTETELELFGKVCAKLGADPRYRGLGWRLGLEMAVAEGAE